MANLRQAHLGQAHFRQVHLSLVRDELRHLHLLEDIGGVTTLCLVELCFKLSVLVTSCEGVLALSHVSLTGSYGGDPVFLSGPLVQYQLPLVVKLWWLLDRLFLLYLLAIS